MVQSCNTSKPGSEEKTLSSFIQRIRAGRARRSKKGVASIVGGALIFAILFSVGYTYLYTAQQDYKSMQNSVAQATQEVMVVTGAASGNNVSLKIENIGSIAITIESIVVVNQTSGTNYGKTYILDSQPSLNYKSQIPFSLNPQTTSKTINTTVAFGSSTFLIEAVTARGTIASTTFTDNPAPASQLSVKALSAGAFGDLYLSFGSYTYYTITSHSNNNNCPGSSQNASYSGYCLQTSSGNTGAGFNIPSSIQSNYGNGLAFSINMTSLNNQSDDIILDQFSLMYQNSFYGNNHQNFVSWYISTVGKTSNGFIPILKNFQPQVLSYDIPKTIYYISGTCVTASTGPTSENSPGGCNSPGSFNGPLGSGQAGTVFLLSNGWELSAGSYQLTQGNSNSLVYSGTGIDVNYGQNSPYVTTLYD